MPIVRYALFAVLISGFASCNQSTETSGTDSTALSDTTFSDSLSGPLVLEESIALTASGSRISLNRGEWYCRAVFQEYDSRRGMLVFGQENGTRREIVSNPWNRQGKLQLTADRDIKLSKGGLYELIYYFQYENPEIRSNKPSGFYLIDIIPRGSYFASPDRYSNTGDSATFAFPKGSRGQFYDDLNGGAVVLDGTNQKPEVYYSTLPSSEKSEVRCEGITENALHVRFPGAASDGFLCWKAGEWIYTDLEGNRRVFRNSVMK